MGQDLRQLWSAKGDKITPDDKNFKIFPEGVLEWGFGPTYKAVVEDKWVGASQLDLSTFHV